MSRMFYNPWSILLAISFSLGGASVNLFMYWGYGWWWDGFFLFLFGMLVGQLIRFILLAVVPLWSESDAAAILPSAGFALSMAGLWLCLPEDLVTVLGHIARALVGGMCGLILAFGLAAMGYPYDTPAHGASESGEPNVASGPSQD